MLWLRFLLHGMTSSQGKIADTQIVDDKTALSGSQPSTISGLAVLMPKQDTVEPVDGDGRNNSSRSNLSRALLRSAWRMSLIKNRTLEKSSGRFSAINTLDDVSSLPGKPGTSISKRPMVFMKPWRAYSTVRVNWQLRLDRCNSRCWTLVQRFRETKSGA